MSKYLLMLLVSASLTFAGCGKDDNKDKKGGDNKARPLQKAEFPNIPQTVFGQWRAVQTDTSNGTTFHTFMYFNSATAGLEIECDSFRGRVRTGFVVNAKIDAQVVEVLEGGSSSNKLADMVCTASIQPGRFRYVVEGNNTLKFIHPNGGAPYVLTRIQ